MCPRLTRCRPGTQGESVTQAVLLGAVVGAVGALPGLLSARAARKGRRPTVALGLGLTLSSFCLVSLALGVGYLYMGSGFGGFAAACVATFLGAWVAETIVAWRWIARGHR